METGLGGRRGEVELTTSAKEIDVRGKDKEESEIAAATFAELVSVTSELRRRIA